MISQVTNSLWFGHHPEEHEIETLFNFGIRSILNVGNGPSTTYTKGNRFQNVVHIPVVDLKRIPDEIALKCLDTLHQMVVSSAAIYVHCIAGQNRSPNILWLYLIACGWSPVNAANRIAEVSYDATPGNPLLVDQALIKLVQAHGKKHFLPHSRPEALQINNAFKGN